MVDILHFWDCLANIIKDHRASSLAPRSEHLLNQHGHCLDVRDAISGKMNIFHMFSYKYPVLMPKS